MISIVEYRPEYQQGIDRMMVGIQEEFPVPITNTQSAKIYEAYKLPGQKFWVALHDNKVVGTIGVILYANHNVAVKRMMVDKQYRGKYFPTAKLLLEKGLDWAKEQGAKTVYLGTMAQFKAAQKFYTNFGFKEIRDEELPGDYTPNPIDALHYKLELA